PEPKLKRWCPRGPPGAWAIVSAYASPDRSWAVAFIGMGAPSAFRPGVSTGIVSVSTGSGACSRRRRSGELRPGSERLQAERESLTYDAGSQGQGGTAQARPAVDLEPSGGPAPERIALAIEHDWGVQAGGRDMRLRRGPQDAGLAHQDHPVDGHGQAVPAE